MSLTLKHSKILGWAFDGNPIYAQFGYTNPNTTAEGVSRLKSSYIRRSTAEINTQESSGLDLLLVGIHQDTLLMITIMIVLLVIWMNIMADTASHQNILVEYMNISQSLIVMPIQHFHIV